MTTSRRIRIQQSHTLTFAQGIADIQDELKLPLTFPPEVESAAVHAAAHPRLPELDRSDIAFITIDPPGSMDLDQAMFLERTAAGYRLYYAIADVAAFVTAGDPLDIEANQRGETLYGADARIPLHPIVLSENAASLLPDQLRPALLWSIDLDRAGESIAIDVRRARIRSRARLDYAGVQQLIDAGKADPMWDILREVGELRRRREQRIGGVSLTLPEQEISNVDGQWKLDYRARHPVEDWNEQISLLTGMAAAQLMVKARVGLLRTLPAPDPLAIERLRRTAAALAIVWPGGQDYPDFIRSLDPSCSRHLAMMVACTSVLRGAGYAAFNGSLPTQPLHSALASEYAHATAPLRRLADRYVGEVCVAVCAGQPVPAWALAALPGLPATMQESDRLAHRFERAVIDLIEAVTLAPRIGESFAAAIIEVRQDDSRQGVVMLRDPAIEGRVTGTADLPLGENVKVTLVEADPSQRTTRFEFSG